MGGIILSFVFMIAIGFWLSPVALIITGLLRLKSKPESAKKLLIIAAIMLVVGLGFCGIILS